MFTSLYAQYSRILGAAAHATAKTGIHPNVLTVISVFPALTAALASAYGFFVLAATLLLVSGIFDLLDGALARASNKASRFGALLDSSLDRVSDAAVPAGLVVFYAPQGGWTLIPVAALVSGFMISYVRARAEGLHYLLPRLWMRREDRMAILVVGLLLAPVPVRGWTLPAPATLLVLALLSVFGFVAAGAALRAAARSG